MLGIEVDEMDRAARRVEEVEARVRGRKNMVGSCCSRVLEVVDFCGSIAVGRGFVIALPVSQLLITAVNLDLSRIPVQYIAAQHRTDYYSADNAP